MHTDACTTKGRSGTDMNIQNMLGPVAGLISLLGFIPYIVEIWRGKTRPNRATWWIWTVVGAMLCASYYASGARHSIWVPISYTVGPFITALLSLKYGEGGFDRFDQRCLAIALLSLVAWWLIRAPLLVLVMNIGVDLMGALPTLRKAYRAPETESGLSWGIFLVANALNVCAIGTWSAATALYPIYLVALSGILVALLSRHRLLRVVSTLGLRPA
jgi:uncharacterized protein with PQ loop repeat